MSTNFPITTIVTWSELPTNEIKNLILDQLPALVAAGKTDGSVVWPRSEAPYEAIREWVDTDSATSWVAFVEANGGPTLASVTIQP